MPPSAVRSSRVLRSRADTLGTLGSISRPGRGRSVSGSAPSQRSGDARGCMAIAAAPWGACVRRPRAIIAQAVERMKPPG
eukprot:8393867-Lingulodinium_polyedra.AAC.1